MAKLCLEHPKTCKSIENRKSKICTKPILSSTYIEESKNITDSHWVTIITITVITESALGNFGENSYHEKTLNFDYMIKSYSTCYSALFLSLAHIFLHNLCKIYYSNLQIYIQIIKAIALHI